MNNDDPREGLSAFLDGELPDGPASAVRRALARDPALRGEAEELQAVDRLLAGHPHVTPTDGFVARAVAAAMTEAQAEVPDRESAGRRLRIGAGFRRWKGRGIAVAAAASVALAAFLWRPW